MSTVTDATTHAPAAPGAMGSAPEPAALQTYLAGLEAWVRARRSELDDLDATALAAGRGAEVGSDMALALSLWKGVSDRYREMWATWDGGRVLQPQRERIASLIWGRLEGQEMGQGMSVPEACRLADALVGLEAEPDGEPETTIDADLLARDANMRFQTSCGQVDVLSREDLAARYGALRDRAIQAEAAGVTVTVVSRDDLIELKAATGRDRDLLDIGDLLAVGEKRPDDP